MKVFVCCFGILLNLSLFATDAENIEKVLNQWPKDFNAKKVQEVCSLFAKDLIATYPDAIDKNYNQMCENLTKVLNDKDVDYSYAQPKIEQIIVEGNLAAVRLIWTLKVAPKSGGDAAVVNERGLDIFRKQVDGTWKIAISYAYPME